MDAPHIEPPSLITSFPDFDTSAFYPPTHPPCLSCIPVLPPPSHTYKQRNLQSHDLSGGLLGQDSTVPLQYEDGDASEEEETESESSEESGIEEEEEEEEATGPEIPPELTLPGE